ncbi:PRX [Symbiodinium sp. CCMP2456]|nr:PRX [Symbiodinium sp. CCMP2456]
MLNSCKNGAWILDALLALAILGEPLSPMSDSRAKGLHYTVKDRRSGYACLICGLAGDIRMIRSEECLPGKVSPERMDMDPTTKSIHRQTQIEFDEKVAREMAKELEQLQAQAVELEQMKILHDLEMEELQLEGLFQQQRALKLHEAATSAAAHKVAPPKSPEVAAPKSTEVAAPKSTEVTAPRSTEVAATTSTEVAAPRSTEVAAPKSTEVAAPRSTEVAAPKSTEVAAPKSTEVAAPKSTEVAAPKSTEVATTESTEVEAPESTEVTAPESTEVTAPESTEVAKPKVEATMLVSASMDNMETQPMLLDINPPLASTSASIDKATVPADEAPAEVEPCPVKTLPAISPADQTKKSGAVANPKSRAKGKRPQSDDDADDDEHDSDACSSGGKTKGRGRGRGRGRGGRGRGRGRASTQPVHSPRNSSTKRAADKDEPKKESKAKQVADKDEPKKESKAKAKIAEEPAPAAKARAKAKAKSKAKAKASPKTSKGGGAKKDPEQEVAPKAAPKKPRLSEEEEKKRKSRKSVAYHKAKTEAMRTENGYSVASYDKTRGHPMDFCSNCGFVLPSRHIDKSGKSCFRGNKAELKQSGIPDSWSLVMESFVKEMQAAKARIASLQSALSRPASTLVDEPAVPGAPATAVSLPGNPCDVAGKVVRNLGSFHVSSQDAQRDPLYHADSDRTLMLPGTPPAKSKASPTKPMMSVSLKKGKGTGDAKTPSRGRSSDGHRSRRHHSHRRHHEHSSSKHGSSCRKKLLSSPAHDDEGSSDDKKSTASSAVRKKLHQLLKQNGDFKAMELQVKKVHKEEEARLILNDNFEMLDETGEEVVLSGSMELEDESGWLLEGGLPSINGPVNEIMNHPSASSGAGHEAVVAGSAASFKMVFPTLAQNSSPVTILASFVDVCGRKIDQSEELHGQIKNMVDDMKKAYQLLTTKQAESVTTAPDKPSFNDELLRTFADVTKKDVMMNNFLLRAKPMVKSVKLAKTPGGGKPKKEKKEKKAKKEKGAPKSAPKSNKRAKTVIWVETMHIRKLMVSTGGDDDLSDFDDDLAQELFMGFANGADSARRVVRLACVADTKLRRHSFTSRLLYTVVPSELYASNTIDKLHEAMVRDMRTLYYDGIEAAWLHLFAVI